MMSNAMEHLLRNYADSLRSLYGSHLKAVILYGSYARGDFNEDSDVDVMVLVDLDDEGIKQKGRNLSNLTYDYNYDNDLMIVPQVVNFSHFNAWVRAYPFYNNIQNEGRMLYAG